MYITASGGNPGLATGTNNDALSLIVGLGPCGNLTPSTFISINEVTSVATIYALAQFMGPTGSVGSYGANNQGLANAFSTINNLVDISNGTARSLTPGGNGVVPLAELNTLGDILAPCVNSGGSTSGACSLLFGTVAPLSGVVPTTTSAAVLSMALNPGLNVSRILQLPTAAAPFQPTVTSINDLTVSIGFAAGGSSPAGIAIDSIGRVWVANHGSGGSTSSVSLLSPLGLPAANSPFSDPSVNGVSAIAVDASNNVWLANHDSNTATEVGATTTGSNTTIGIVGGPFGGLNAPSAIAIDRSSNVWVTNGGNNSLSELLASGYGNTPSTFSDIGLNAPQGIAFDDAGYAWVSNNAGGSVSKLNVGGTPVASTNYSGGGLANPGGIAIDSQSNVWTTDTGHNAVVELNSSGSPVSPGTGYIGGGLTASVSDAIDGSGNLWVADGGGTAISEINASGVVISPPTGFRGSLLSSPSAIAIDASGNVWAGNRTAVTSGAVAANLSEFVGLAAPTITPLALAVRQGQIGQKPGSPAVVPVANAGGPYSAAVGASITFDGSKSTAPSGQALTYAWTFGDGGTGVGVSPTHTYAAGGSYTASLTVTATNGVNASASAVVTIGTVSPSISGFSPGSGPVGTLVTLSGTNLIAAGTATQVTLSQQGGGTISAPVSGGSSGSLSFVVPAGAASGPVTVAVGANTATSSSLFTVTTSSSFTLAVAPAAATVIQGQSTSLAVTISSVNSFPGLATLSVSGIPSGVSASFQPSSIAVGQTALLTLSAPAGQGVGSAQLTLTASAVIEGQTFSQNTNASLNVKALSTTFLGRTVVDDAVQEPIAGVTVKLLGVDDKGNVTGCSGQTASDGGGNFMLTNLPAACVGPQLISYDGLTATAPAGKFAGVNLSYTLVSGQVTASPVLVHLPRIDNAETVQVQQNASTDQVFYFHTIPGVKTTVYAGTTLTMPDGTTPNPFPLVAISIPLDRLPDQIPTTGMLMPFIVAFQPANAFASQPVAVNFPNSLGVAPNTSVMFVTLDPTHGYMVPYGTGTVSSDGTEFVADADPNHAGHAYGLLHFDWHGPMVPPPAAMPMSPDEHKAPPPPTPPCPTCPSPASAAPMVGDPVDLGSGIVTYSSADIGIAGARGALAVHRVYRTAFSNPGPFGLGTSHEYNYVLNTQAFILTFLNYTGSASVMTLTLPDGNQYSFAQTPNGSFVNSSIPSLRGAVLTYTGTAPLINCSIRWAEGTTYNFTSYTSGSAYLTSIVDLNGNTTTISRNQSQPTQITSVTDPVGRSLTFTSDSSNRVTQITDPIGRKVKYTYNSAGTLANFTDANGGVTSYTYDTSNNLATTTDARGVVVEQNTYNESFDGRITQQVLADGGVIKFAYTLQNPKVATSPVLQTVVTDPLGNQTTYRYNTQGFLTSVTDASGQTRTLTRDPDHFNMVSDYTGNGTCSACGDPAAGDVHYTFDALGNILTKTDSLGNKATFGYDTRFNFVNSITDPLGDTTKMVYDANGNLTSVTDANGHTTQAGYDSFGEPIQTMDPTGAKTTIVYDSFGDVTSVTNALGNTTSLSYDGAGRLTQVQDALGRKGLTAYDALDRVTKVTDPLKNVTQLTYDPVGDLMALTDPKGNITSFVYDSRQRLSTRIDPLKRQQGYVYDVNSNLTQFTDRRGQISKFGYDVLNRQIAATYQDSTVAYTFDPAGRVLAVNDSMDGTFAFKYDVAGRLLQQDEPTGIVQYARDALGRILSKQVVGQGATSYTYDAVGNVLSAALPSAGVNLTYDQRNLPLTLSRTNGVVSTYSFDAIGELLSLVHAKGAAALNSQTYTYDKVGKRSAVENDLSQPLTTQATTNTPNADNQLVSSSATAYTYDQNGNRLTETTSTGKVSYTWDSRNRLISISNVDGSTVAMHYDFGRNLLELDRSSGGAASRQRFVVDSITNVVSLTDSTGSPVSVLTLGGLDSHLASSTAAGSVSFGLGDALGSIGSTTDASGQLGNKLSYDPYGQTSGVPLASFLFAYTGRVLINGGVYYNRDRFYDSTTASFLSEDPLDVISGVNLYSYANGDPLSNTDPSGDSAIGNIIDIGVGAVAGGGFAALDKESCRGDILVGAATGLAGAALTAGTVAIAVALAPEAAALAAATIAGAVAGAIFGAAADYTNQLYHQHYYGGDINTGEIIGSGVGGGLGGIFGGILGDPLEELGGKVLGSVVRNANTLPFGFGGMIGKGIQNKGSKPGESSDSCGCPK